jgi:hypothetical protein
LKATTASIANPLEHDIVSILSSARRPVRYHTWGLLAPVSSTALGTAALVCSLDKIKVAGAAQDVPA